MKSHFTKELANLISPLHFGHLLCYGSHVATLFLLDLNGPMHCPLG